MVDYKMMDYKILTFGVYHIPYHKISSKALAPMF